MRARWTVVVAVLALGCTRQERGGGGGDPTRPRPPGAALPVTATLSAVTLADDCAHADASESERRKRTLTEMEASESQSRANCPPEGCGGACAQTTMMLAFEAAAGATPARVELVRVELIDVATGKSLGEMHPRNGRRWVEAANAYQVWDGAINPTQHLMTMFDLSAPDWSSIGGRFQASGKTFRVKATVTIDGAATTVGIDTTMQQQITSPDIFTDPMIET
jgi:hypothetical protein